MVSAGPSALGQRARLEARVPQSPTCVPPLLLLVLLELVRKSAAESPWGLPVVTDGPASLAKVVMAELASMKLENKPWPGGMHSLHYHYLALSEPGPSLPQFLAVGYVDDQPFMRYDSRTGRAEPQAPWIAPMDAQYWETETQKQRAWAEVQQVEMWTVMGYHNHSGGMHSAQRMFGCNVQEDGRFSSFWEFGFDGQDHLSLDLETLSWVSASPMAVRTKRWWESERCYAEYDKAYLEGLCLTSLRRYLELGGQSLTRREPPTVQVTRHTTQDTHVTLKCWALGFYPQEISLSWWLGEEELAMETEHVEARPSGDGTYQIWAAVQVPAGEEAGYTCYVQHSGLNQTLTVSWSTVSWEPPSHRGLIAMLFCPVLFLLAFAVVILTRRCLQELLVKGVSVKAQPHLPEFQEKEIILACKQFQFLGHLMGKGSGTGRGSPTVMKPHKARHPVPLLWGHLKLLCLQSQETQSPQCERLLNSTRPRKGLSMKQESLMKLLVIQEDEASEPKPVPPLQQPEKTRNFQPKACLLHQQLEETGPRPKSCPLPTTV